MASELKMSDAPKGATHWQPKTELARECFYKKVPSGVSRYIVAPEDDRCNEWNSNEGRGEVSVIEVLPIYLINERDRLIEENKQQRESLDAFRELVKAQTKTMSELNEESLALQQENAELREALKVMRKGYSNLINLNVLPHSEWNDAAQGLIKLCDDTLSK